MKKMVLAPLVVCHRSCRRYDLRLSWLFSPPDPVNVSCSMLSFRTVGTPTMLGSVPCLREISWEMPSTLTFFAARRTGASAATNTALVCLRLPAVWFNQAHHVRKSILDAARSSRKCTWQVDGTGNADGMVYSVATRVVQQYPGPGSRLQVQVLYGDTIEDMLENMPDPADAPGWSWTPSSQEIHQGGREIRIDVSCAE